MPLQTLPAPLNPDRTAGPLVVQRPGAERAALIVDADIRALVVSDTELARSHVQVTDAPDRTGFEVLSAAPDGAEGTMGDLRRAFAPGVDEILSSLESIQDSIADLLTIARTPDQTWALEQFSIAHTAFGRGLIDEALTYINRAIEGDGVRSGFPLDHRFYVFRGLLRVGDARDATADVVDLDAATEDFLLAARYAERVDEADRARALGLAGWTALRLGDAAAAETHLRADLSEL